MKKQIETQELAKLQNLATVIKTTQEQVGMLETQKHVLLHKYDILSQELNKFKSELQEKYGDVSIDIKDGSFKKIKNESNKKD
jgi:archaellum component FlaC